MTGNTPPLAVYYEHPEWFRPLFAELDRRGTPYVRLDAARHSYDVSDAHEYSLVFNRMSASAYLRGHGNALFYTRYFLEHLERSGTRVVNGTASYAIETSKALQLSLLGRLGLPRPRTRVVNSAAQVTEAAEGLGFPVMVKPNVGGRGAGVVRFDTPASLARAAEEGGIDFGIDHTALVQEFIPARGGHITRVETLGGKFLYAIKVFTTGESFNLCPADICQVEEAPTPASVAVAKKPLKIEAASPPGWVIDAVVRVFQAGGLDIGGVEYLESERDGQIYLYDVNAISNFVTDAPRLVGFDPFVRFVDYLEQRVGIASEALAT